MIKNKQNKKGQLTLLIIVAVIIVVLMFVLFILWPTGDVGVSPATDPPSYIKQCTEDATEEAIAILSEQGGDIEPEGSVMYNDKEIQYLCYNDRVYVTCINQRPLLVEHIEQEITDYVEPRVKQCFLDLKEELQDRGYEVSMGSMETTTELQSKRVFVTIKRNLDIRKGDESRKFSEFRTGISHPIYDLSKIAMEVANQEARFCNFDVTGFMIVYPEYDADKFRTGDSDTIYTIKDVATDKEFKFAIRSCAMPAGL